MIKKILFLLMTLIPIVGLAAPLNPNNLQLEALSGTSVSITWQDNSADETGFKIYRDDAFIAIIPADSTSYIDTNLHPNTTYTYMVKATDDALKINISKTDIKPQETIAVSVMDLPGNKGDWVGIYPKGSTNDWGNVVSWTYTNGTKRMDKYGITIGTLQLDGVATGEYEARLFYNNSFELVEQYPFSVGENRAVNIPKFGARPVASTPIEAGKLFASVNGDGDDCTKVAPCDIHTAINKLSPTKNVLFLLSGTYLLDQRIYLGSYKKGTQDTPYIIESLDPNDKAQLVNNADIIELIKLYQTEYIQFRNLVVRGSVGFGIRLRESSHITIEGCDVYNNQKSGISLYGASNNIIMDNVTYNNKDKALGNADGIQIEIANHESQNNQIIHNTVYDNSDDGIDTIAGVNTTIQYNISYANLGEEGENGGKGNGIGIKACGAHAKGSIIDHNIAFDNGGNGMECYANDGSDVVFAYNTSYHNGRNDPNDLYHGYGFGLEETSQATLHHNISSNNKLVQTTFGHQENNSWAIKAEVPFISTDIHSQDFLKPSVGSGFEDMGAYVNIGEVE